MGRGLCDSMGGAGRLATSLKGGRLTRAVHREAKIQYTREHRDRAEIFAGNGAGGEGGIAQDFRSAIGFLMFKKRLPPYGDK